jgi:hypothetical protein
MPAVSRENTRLVVDNADQGHLLGELYTVEHDLSVSRILERKISR